MSLESTFGQQILRRHGARNDLRLFRNSVISGWVGQFVSRSPSGIVSLKHASMLHGGLPEGSADYIGIRRGGGLLSLEIKKEGRSKTGPLQFAWRDMILGLGGEAVIAKNMDEVDELLGEP